MLILHRDFQIACLVFLFLNNYYIRKKKMTRSRSNWIMTL